MRVKLFAFAAGLLATALLGVTQLQVNAALPGQVGDAPRCTVDADGDRASAFSIKNNVATTSFKVSGPANCKVRVSANSFYAPSMDGRPYDKQILFQRETREYGPGHYSLAVALPTKSTQAKGCFYQVDLTYGTHNVTPVLAYGHGTLDCSVPPEPIASCDGLTVASLSRTQFRFSTSATAKNGATITSYTYTVQKNGQVVDTKTVPSSSNSNSIVYDQAAAGKYTVSATVNTSLGAKSGANCSGAFEVTTTPPTPEKVKVCDPDTGEIIEVDKKDEGNYAAVDSEDCAGIEVCEIATGEIVTIDKSEMDSSKYTQGDCPEEDSEDVPEELPTTGPVDTALKVVGAASLAGASGYYFMSRRRD